MERSLLIYDGSNAWFRSAAATLQRCSADLQPVDWGSAEIQAFLQAQFDDRPFAFMLVEGDTVHVGDRTVRRMLKRQDLPRTVVAVVQRAYPLFAGPFGRAFHGEPPADIHGSFQLTAAAQTELAPLRREYTVPVSEESSTE